MNLTRIGIDIGGSLIKITCKGDELQHVFFSKNNQMEALKFINSIQLKGTKIEIYLTGGGANEMKKKIAEQFKCSTQIVDEMESIVKGYLEYERDISPSLEDLILVNIGTGTSILRVNSDGSFKRISGTALGGGSFMGFARAIGLNFDGDFLGIFTKSGNSRNCNLTVGDIYHGSYENIGLDKEMIASFLGKIKDGNVISSNDLMMSFTEIILDSIVHIVTLYCKLENVQKCVFTGGFTSMILNCKGIFVFIGYY